MTELEILNKDILTVKNLVYDKCDLNISEFEDEAESKEYTPSRFKLEGLNIVCRKAKTTPKKIGQFVTFWKRKGDGPIEPLSETDSIDFYLVIVQTKTEFGQFVFPKAEMIKRAIMSSKQKEGKRAFRVYPPWDTPTNQQALRTQIWQLNYYIDINHATDLLHAKELYQK